MPDVSWVAFLVITTTAFAFFFFEKRNFDFLTIAFIGAVFYFAPLFWGQVIQSNHSLPTTIQPVVYVIATCYLIGLVIAGIISQRFDRDTPTSVIAHRDLSIWYLLLALVALTSALVSSKGAIINADKVIALESVGYLYVLFEISASLACISGAIGRRWWIVAGGAFFLILDLLIGFRAFAVLTGLSVALVMLMRDGSVRLVAKTSSYGLAALLFVAAMLLTHTARYAIFDNIAVLKSPDQVFTPKMRGDVLQYDRATAPLSDPRKATSPTAKTAPTATTTLTETTSAVWKWVQIPYNLLQHSEPSIIQATLVGVVDRNLTCKPSNILKSLYLLIPPGLTRFIPNTYPPTFFDEYQPVLYPDMHYGGLGGNIWAEMLCRFGYVGVAAFGILMILALLGLYWCLRHLPPAFQGPVAFGGVIVAFYINRNDLHYTLVMIRQVGIVFILAYGLSTVVTWAQMKYSSDVRT